MTNCSGYDKVTTANGLVINYHGGGGEKGNLGDHMVFRGGAEGGSVGANKGGL